MTTKVQNKPWRSTATFVPELVYFEPDALLYPKGQKILDWAKSQSLPIRMTTSHNRITNLPRNTRFQLLPDAWDIAIIVTCKLLLELSLTYEFM